MNHISGEALGAELFQLVEVTQVHLPGMASVYNSCGTELENAAEEEGSMFTELTSFNDKWIELRKLLNEIVSNTETNLNEVNSALRTCIVEYAESDEAAAKQLRQSVEEANEGRDGGDLLHFPLELMDLTKLDDNPLNDLKQEDSKDGPPVNYLKLSGVA